MVVGACYKNVSRLEVYVLIKLGPIKIPSVRNSLNTNKFKFHNSCHRIIGRVLLEKNDVTYNIYK